MMIREYYNSLIIPQSPAENNKRFVSERVSLQRGRKRERYHQKIEEEIKSNLLGDLSRYKLRKREKTFESEIYIINIRRNVYYREFFRRSLITRHFVALSEADFVLGFREARKTSPKHQANHDDEAPGGASSWY